MNVQFDLDNLLVGGIYNRFAGELWLWMIFVEWIYRYLFS
jgi:hypothetical protein